MAKLSIQMDLETGGIPLTLLAQQLQCDEQDLPARLADQGRAALREYIDMFTGEALLDRASEIRENRLRLMIVHALNDSVPTEAWVSRTFHLTASGARSLLRTVLARYRPGLEEPLAKAIRELLGRCREDEENQRVFVEIPDVSFAEAVNEEIYELWLEKPDEDFLPRLTLTDRSTSTFVLASRSFEALKKKFAA
jgi:hypothetical protein